MNIGLIGWGIASGNGGMNSDVAELASWVTHWLVPDHPNSKIHEPYIEKPKGKEIIHCKADGDKIKYTNFLEAVDGILYIENPCLRDSAGIIEKARSMGKLTIGIPMWEWWPERKPWSLGTDVLWAVTKLTRRYLNSLSDVLYWHGHPHNWRGRVYGAQWGVNLNKFKFESRSTARRLVFINGNGGYKLRKASDIIFKAFSLPGSPPLTVYTQGKNIHEAHVKNISIIEKNFDQRQEVYETGDVFLFPSYWEGLCHGIYEGQACGGIVVTTDHPPMNECGSPYLLPVSDVSCEDLSGKQILKAIPNVEALHDMCRALYESDIKIESKKARENIERNFDLQITLNELYYALIQDVAREA
jgi:glycosyltransferase involved in cell wall biosynthesis